MATGSSIYMQTSNLKLLILSAFLLEAASAGLIPRQSTDTNNPSHYTADKKSGTPANIDIALFLTHNCDGSNPNNTCYVEDVYYSAPLTYMNNVRSINLGRGLAGDEQVDFATHSSPGNTDVHDACAVWDGNALSPNQVTPFPKGCVDLASAPVSCVRLWNH